MNTRNQQNTQLVFILDQSGSMHPLSQDTIGGFNSMLEQQKNLPDPCEVTTVLFNDRVSVLHDRMKIKNVANLTTAQYHPGGTTALLDAIGFTLKRMIRREKGKLSLRHPSQVMFVIITDGQENASQYFDLDEIRNMILQAQEAYGWEFIFLGANMDAVAAAGDLGISASRAAQYEADSASTILNFQAMSHAAASMRETGALDDACLEPVRQNFAARKNKGRSLHKKH